MKTIANKIGENIFKARVESALGEQYLKEVESILKMHPF